MRPRNDKADPTDQTDPRFKYEVSTRPGGENLMLCYACGTCTASCPVAQVDSNFDPRRIIRAVLLGLKKEILSSPAIWFCAQCHTCTAKCPQNVRFREIVRVLWEMAAAEGYANQELPRRIEQLNRAVHKWRRDAVKALLTDPARFESMMKTISG